ncbi:MAG: ribonuclease H-like domain-containing protein [Spirochaetales bacterium]|jgi:uncharacterized protein YprB with RNaseH-like and TPR domain|nr:ribonuclease H-like domain-containing protein [Spirochaetales bacterium]
MASLKDRLQAIRQNAPNPKPAPARSGSPPEPRPPEAEGWRREGDFVFRRDLRVPLAAGTLNKLRAAADFFLRGPRLEDLLWYDTETTGLSGGAGTHVFLYGGARVSKTGNIDLVQLFLTDFPGEKAFLSGLTQNCAGRACMLSYNGRAFDLPLLKNRFILNRLSSDFPPQFDLLFTTRRLWKGILPDCSLGSVERHILRKSRVSDIPGILIPQVYFDYLAGSGGLMEKVVSHHRDDILSLIDLFALFGDITENPFGYTSPGNIHAAALGCMIEDRRPGRGIAVLRESALRGDAASLFRLSRYYKRAGAFGEAEQLWASLAQRSALAALELAKHLEHRVCDCEAALLLTEKLLTTQAGEKHLFPGLGTEALAKRRDRLLGKIRRKRQELC